MIDLPQVPTEPKRLNAKRIILFSSPKSGKTEALSRLGNNLIIDLEDGAGFVGGLKINVLETASKNNVSPLTALKMVIDSIKEANAKKGSFVYQYISVDTVSALEDTYALELALRLYKQTPMGRNFQGTDVRTLPNGAGYGPLRSAVQLILNEINSLCDTLIISGHTKDKVIESEGKEMTARGLDLAGKLASIVCAESDAIAYLYRKNNQTIANFKPSESLTVGARPLHLKNKEIVLLESDEEGNLTSYWDKIFI